MREKARQSGHRGYLGEGAEGILERMAKWADERVAQDLPLHVEEVKIYPEQMPLDTLQFTERLGYRKENAIRMLTMGCYNTLWALREHLEKRPKSLDERDEQVLALAQKWMGFPELPKDFRSAGNAAPGLALPARGVRFPCPALPAWGKEAHIGMKNVTRSFPLIDRSCWKLSLL